MLIPSHRSNHCTDTGLCTKPGERPQGTELDQLSKMLLSHYHKFGKPSRAKRGAAVDTAHLPAPSIYVCCKGNRCWHDVKMRNKTAQKIRLEVIMRNITHIKGLEVLKSEAGALPSSRAKRGQSGRTGVDDGGGVWAIFTRRMLQQLRERNPEPWWLTTADDGVRFTSRGISDRCCCYCLASVQHPLRREVRLVGANLRDMSPPATPKRQHKLLDDGFRMT
uniref:uncharacterized protein LOC109973404 n=1 Tax=Monopterus albus TaxID=43700 RepID=UPI0009B3617A|nr:uncharacterized protein LOC109973404 [Monopterus albus]